MVDRTGAGAFRPTELAGGIAPSGRRVVSAANLASTWAPGVAVPSLYGGPPEMAASMSHYGLGWMSGEYRGLREISHTGGTTGFTAQVAFLPAADLGIAILANASASPGALAFAFAVQFRLLEPADRNGRPIVGRGRGEGGWPAPTGIPHRPGRRLRVPGSLHPPDVGACDDYVAR